MARDGGKTKKSKKATMLKPDPQSLTSQRRANRGFKSLELSSRIHKRAANRQAPGRIFDSKNHEPGEKAQCAGGPNPRKQWIYTASGKIKYH